MEITSCCTFSLNSSFFEKHEIQYFRNIKEIKNGFRNTNCKSILAFPVVFLAYLLDLLSKRSSEISTQNKGFSTSRFKLQLFSQSIPVRYQKNITCVSVYGIP